MSTPPTQAELDRLRAYVVADCFCPCCTESVLCLPGCTFKDDCDKEFVRMEAAREAAFGPVGGRAESSAWFFAANSESKR